MRACDQINYFDILKQSTWISKSSRFNFFESTFTVYMPLFPHGNPKFGALLKHWQLSSSKKKRH
ncbi:hypothetical protein T05_1364 [Trichinella murrelli]|uniref:Uncharacterized protein n=1 Tax=Trichinella murrelli TaxID=144512 RepID=A0A0V0SY80_9BILA|nr:hypothetical protein T05_1364 [Trichinella murrelli]